MNVARLPLSLGIVVATACVVVACKRSYEDDLRRVVVRDHGALCLGVASGAADAGRGASTSVVAGAPLAVRVRTGCLSLACSTKRESRCAVKREGNKLVVSSELSWRAPSDIGARCPRECEALEATCESEALEPGVYEVHLGGKVEALTVPSQRDVACDDEAPPRPAPPPPPRLETTPAVASATPPRDVADTDVPAAPGTGVPASPPPRDLVCFSPAQGGVDRTLHAGKSVSVSVFRKNPCEDASCSAGKATCTAHRRGDRLVVEATFPSATDKPRALCTEDCPAIVATCRTEALPEGSYVVEIGDAREALRIPSPEPRCGD